MTHPFAASASAPAGAIEGFPIRRPSSASGRRQEFAAFLHAKAQQASPASRPDLSAIEFQKGKTVVSGKPAAEEPLTAPPARARAHDVSQGKPPANPLPESADPPGLDKPFPGGGPGETPGSAGERFVPPFADVPAWAKAPLGPFRQAPEEFGGQWWPVTPFTGEHPWLRRTAAETAAPEPLPAGFEKTFGPRPQSSDFRNARAFRVANVRWEQDLKFFEQAGLPDGYTQEEVDLASDNFEQWDMGRPTFYKGRYGWMARFPDASIAHFEASPIGAIKRTHLIIARYQIRQLQNGVQPLTRHPFLPLGLFPAAETASVS